MLSDQPDGCALGAAAPGAAAPGVATLRESRRKTPSAPASNRATSPAMNCGPIAIARLLISSCTPLAKPKYTRMGAIPAMVLTLLARPLPANTRRPAASCTSTHESAEKLKRRRARPTPAVASGSDDGVARAVRAEAAPPGGVDGADDGSGDGAAGSDIVGEASAEGTTATADSAALSADAALGCAARLSPATGAAPR